MRRRVRGFTLIEVMIVTAILSILASITVPSLIRSRIAANETSCQAALKQIVATEGVWRQVDADRNGIQDYWTNDVAGFHAFTDGAGQGLQFVDVRVARADATGWGRYTLPPYNLPGGIMDKSGYYFQAMTTDELGNTYQLDPTGSGFGTNETKYGFCGYPAYAATGTRQYIVNEQGVVYARDLGTGAPPTLTWPSANPSSVGWTPAD